MRSKRMKSNIVPNQEFDFSPLFEVVLLRRLECAAHFPHLATTLGTRWHGPRFVVRQVIDVFLEGLATFKASMLHQVLESLRHSVPENM